MIFKKTNEFIGCDDKTNALIRVSKLTLSIVLARQSWITVEEKIHIYLNGSHGFSLKRF